LQQVNQRLVDLRVSGIYKRRTRDHCNITARCDIGLVIGAMRDLGVTAAKRFPQQPSDTIALDGGANAPTNNKSIPVVHLSIRQVTHYQQRVLESPPFSAQVREVLSTPQPQWSPQRSDLPLISLPCLS
jgi:hypothetical protein